jgi:predicted transcriptional regulator
MTYQETSREAWERITPVSAHLDRQILATLSARPRTDQEIEAAIERDHQAVSGNRCHLVERGLVEPSGEFGQTRSGRRAIIWRLTQLARAGHA